MHTNKAIITKLCFLLLAIAAFASPLSAQPLSWTAAVDLSATGQNASSQKIALSSDGTRATAVWTRYSGTHHIVQTSSATISGNTPTWSSVIDLSAVGQSAYIPQVEISSDGTRATAFWVRYNGSHNIIQTASATISGNTATWSSVVDITAAGQNADFPQIALSSDGTRATAVWRRANGSNNIIQTASATISGNTATWGSVVDLSATGQHAELPQIALSSDGTRASAVWYRSNGTNTIIQTSSATISGNTATWGSVVDLSASGQSASEQQIALSSDGTKASAVWSRVNGAEYIVQTSSATISGNTATWSSVVDLSASGQSSLDGQIALSSDGTKASAVWVRNNGIHTITQTSAASISGNTATWSSVVDLSATGQNAESPQIDLSSDGTKASAVWVRNNGTHTIIQTSAASISGNTATWSSVVDLSATGQNALDPEIALSSDGTAASAVWHRSNGGVTIVQSSSAGIPEIDVSGNSVTIVDGDTSASTTDDTDFGSVNVGSLDTNTFTVTNTGSAVLSLTGSPRITLSGSAAFTVSTQPTATVAASGGTSTFVIQFAPTTTGSHSATVSIDNDDSNENPYNFSIQGTGVAPEMDVSGNSVSVTDGDTSASTTDDTDFGSVNAGSTDTNTFTVTNSGTAVLNLTGSPRVTLSGSAAFTVTTQPSSTVTASGGTSTIVIRFAPTTTGTHSATVSIDNNDSNENPYNFSIQGVGADPTDSDGDGDPDSSDPDDDNDGVTDAQEGIDGTNSLDSGSSVQVLPTTFCSEWNSHLGMLNVNEYANATGASRSLDVTLFDLNGTALSTTGTSVLASSQRDVLVHDLSGIATNSYGRTCTTVGNGAAGDVDGRTVFYHPNGLGFDFALALPYFAGRTGSQFVQFNTFHPGSFGTNSVANWVTVINDSTSTQSGSLYYYAQDGSVLGTESASISAGGRRDFAAHRFGANLVGLIEWRPSSTSAKFVVRNIRYYYDNSNFTPSFNSAMQLEGARGNGELLVLPLDKRNGTAVLELSNATNAAITVAATFRSSAGNVVGTTTYSLAAYSTTHEIVDSFLVTDLGSVTLDGSARGSVVAVSTHYSRTSGFELLNAYSLFAGEATGSVLRSSYNTFLGQSCDLILVNNTGSAVTSSVTLTRNDGTVVANGVQVVTGANGVTNYDLCANDSANNYGSVVVMPSVSGSISGAVVRRGTGDRYQFATKLR